MSSILVCLFPLFEKRSTAANTENIILKEFLSKEKDNYWREEIIYLANRGAHYRLDKCAKTINLMMKKADIASYYFNNNDINLIMDILLREVLTNQESKTRCQILRLMETLLNNDIYKEQNYKIEEVEEMIDEQIKYEEDEIADK